MPGNSPVGLAHPGQGDQHLAAGPASGFPAQEAVSDILLIDGLIHPPGPAQACHCWRHPSQTPYR